MKTTKAIFTILSLVAGAAIIILALLTDKTIPAIIGAGILITNAVEAASMEISENIRDEIRQATATMIAWNSSKSFRKHFEGRVKEAERAADEAEQEEAND
jgi:hypothetical protein